MFVLYLYTTPLISQCSGSISEVEFCFLQQPVEMAATERLFTLVALKQMGNTFRVVTRSNVSTATANTCNEFDTITRCCGRRRLEPAVEITQDSAYGIETTEAGSSRLLTFLDIRRPGRVLSLAGGVSFDVNTTVPPDPSASEIRVAMVRFIVICKSIIQHLHVCKHHTVFIGYILVCMCVWGGGGGENEVHIVDMWGMR